jgi:hypothetical protein
MLYQNDSLPVPAYLDKSQEESESNQGRGFHLRPPFAQRKQSPVLTHDIPESQSNKEKIHASAVNVCCIVADLRAAAGWVLQFLLYSRGDFMPALSQMK